MGYDNTPTRTLIKGCPRLEGEMGRGSREEEVGEREKEKSK
jgi:hypothetical protein